MFSYWSHIAQARWPSKTHRAALWVAVLCAPATHAALRSLPAAPALAQASPDLSIPAIRWAEQAAANEEHIVNYDTATPLRYKMRRVDAKGEMIRETVESKEGPVARLLQRNGQALTAEENEAERRRLQDILDSPDSFLRHVRREEGSKSYAAELLRSMAKAMIWTYVPNQPQLPGASGPAVVLDFKPDPAFKPPSLVTEALTGVSGRVWIDANSHCVTRIEGRILHSIDFGWGGVLARIKEGGSVELEQRKVSDHRWLYSHLVEHIAIREVLVHTVEENADITSGDIQALPGPLGYREAIHMLLALPVPTR